MATRRSVLLNGAMAVGAVATSRFDWADEKTLPPRRIAQGPFQPTWDSLKGYRAPDWFRDAKFGIWAHWDAQCVPEQGDWYARQMYLQGHPQNKYHVEHYGHPSKSGWLEMNHRWKAERWEPEALMDLYHQAGARYFMTLANHHDNFDCFNSKWNAWNSTKVGPQKDIVGGWIKAARARQMRVGVSVHAPHAWHWLQTAYGYDPEGPLAGVRYDAYNLTKADGKGKWWEGLDPQELYVGRSYVMPDGIKTIAEANQWHEQHDRVWDENPPAQHPEFADRWFLRTQDLIDQYDPDLVYFDDNELPLGQTGLDITAHLYNQSVRRRGKLEVVATGKEFTPEHQGATMLDIERGRASGILPQPWQTDTCIGDWHYKRSIFEEHRYKSVKTVAQTLVDVISKNGNLMLSVPVRGDGTLDEDEHAFLQAMARWIGRNGEGVYGTRPAAVFGEGPPDVTTNSNFNEGKARPYDERDIRFTRKGDTLYVYAMAWPKDGKLRVEALKTGGPVMPSAVKRVETLGSNTSLTFRQTPSGLEIDGPASVPDETGIVGLKVL
jgi:alpha-L-fucosidase